MGNKGRFVYRIAFGWRSLEPTRETITVDTIFDLASLTKCSLPERTTKGIDSLPFNFSPFVQPSVSQFLRKNFRVVADLFGHEDFEQAWKRLLELTNGSPR